MYKVIIDELIFTEDFKDIDPSQQKRIIKTIRKKLSLDPQSYGAPLTGNLKNYWKLKVGPFRVVYAIHPKDSKVDVFLVGWRRNEEVYLKAARRLGLI